MERSSEKVSDNKQKWRTWEMFQAKIEIRNRPVVKRYTTSLLFFFFAVVVVVVQSEENV